MPMRMRVAEFMPLVQEQALALLPDGLRDGATSRVRSVWLQVHYHHPKVHYEVWLTRKTGRIEIGLHFEGPRDFSYRWAELMSPHVPEIRQVSGRRSRSRSGRRPGRASTRSLPYDPLSEPSPMKSPPPRRDDHRPPADRGTRAGEHPAGTGEGTPAGALGIRPPLRQATQT